MAFNEEQLLTKIQLLLDPLAISIEKMSMRIDNLETRVNEFQLEMSKVLVDNDKLRKEVKLLKISLNVSRQENLTRHMIIKNLGETESAAQPLKALVLNCFHKLQPDFLDTDLLHVSRLGQHAQGKTRFVLAEFSYAAARNRMIILKRKAYARKEKGSPDEDKVSFHEHLTKPTLNLLQNAMKLKQLGMKYVWVRNGIVKARMNDGEPEIKLWCVEDIAGLERDMTKKRRASSSPVMEDRLALANSSDNAHNDDPMDSNAAEEVVSKTIDQGSSTGRQTRKGGGTNTTKRQK